MSNHHHRPNKAGEFAQSYRDCIRRVESAALEYSTALDEYAAMCRALSVAGVIFKKADYAMAESALTTMKSGVVAFNKFYDRVNGEYSRYLARERDIASARANKVMEVL